MMIGYISSTKQTKGQVFVSPYTSAVLGIKAKQISIHIILLNSNGSPYLIPHEPVLLRSVQRTSQLAYTALPSRPGLGGQHYVAEQIFLLVSFFFAFISHFPEFLWCLGLSKNASVFVPCPTILLIYVYLVLFLQ